MNETTRTLTFVGVAAALAAAAFGMHAVNQPPSLAEFSDVGEEFYPKFEDPRDATGLRVAAYNQDAARVDVFNVEFKDGLWRIPSHHDYPADGEEQLAKTATSVIGLERGALVSTAADDHKRLGVLDPLDESVTGTEGRGDRVTLTRGDEVLVDYIIGDEIEDGPANTFNVRRADENRTYRVTLDLDIKTKFADWIEPDLLELQRGQLRELVIDRYSVDETRGIVNPGVRSELTRASQDDPWKLEGIDAGKEQVKVSTVNQMINALMDLKIVGVRPKPAGLSASLRGEGNGIDGRAVIDLERKGFFIDSRGALASNEGDFQLATADGARYVLRFGEVFTGSDVEIEIGKSSADDAEEETTEPDADAEAIDDEAAEEDADDSETDSGNKRSRYVFITAEFDESMIEPLPEKPVKPEAPKEVDSDESDEAKSDDADESNDAPAENDAEEDEKPAEDAAARDSNAETDADSDKPDPRQEYEQALAAYERELQAWEANEAARKEQVKAGEERVQELNNRFADWYYVISAETFDKIRVSPEELVEPVPEDANAAGAQTVPPVAPVLPEVRPAAEKEMPAEEPAADSADAPANETPADAKPDDSEGKADKPESDKPAADETETSDEAAKKPGDAGEKPAEGEAGDKPSAEDAADTESAPEESADNES